jgi:hypothetical protein
MRRRSERGEGNVGTIILLALVAAAALAAWNVIPVYYDHYDFTDAVEEICRTPRYKAKTDKVIMDMLMKEVNNRRLGEWIGPESFEISANDRNRMIDLYYEREFNVLPGWKMNKVFEYTAEQPLI